MKISVLTASFNRAELIGKLYESLVRNSKYEVDIEWLIMDDGSTDNTYEVVNGFNDENFVDIKYFKQENQGKMVSLNSLIKFSTGELIIECDSDDYFTDDAFEIIKEEYEKNKEDDRLYGMCFLKNDQNGKIMGEKLKEEKTTMFDLRFKNGIDGEMVIVFFSKVRRQYVYKLEKDERFVTEARMYYQMDLNYQIICVNKVIMICEYMNEGYSHNIRKIFKENPKGYFEFFREILMHNGKKILFKERIYAIKHYILFSYLTKQKHPIRNVNGVKNKFLVALLYLPGCVKSINFVR